MKKKRMSLTKDSERRLREFRVGAGLVAYKVSNDSTGYFEFYTDPKNQMRFIGNGKLVGFEIEYDEDGFEIFADAVEKQETSALERQLADAQAENERMKSAMNKAVHMLDYMTLHSCHAAHNVLKKAVNGEDFSQIEYTPIPVSSLTLPKGKTATVPAVDHDPNCETCGGTGGYIINDPYMADGVGQRNCNCKNPAVSPVESDVEAIEKGYYRQILTEALRVINELHLSGGTRYNEEWLAKANDFMTGNAALVAEETEIVMDEEVVKLAKHQASSLSAAQLRHMESYRKSSEHQIDAPKVTAVPKFAVGQQVISHAPDDNEDGVGQIEAIHDYENNGEFSYDVRFAKYPSLFEYEEWELEANAPQSQVTLSSEEIDWFAKHYSDHDEFRLMPEEGYVDWLDNKAVRFYTSLTKGSLYELRESYNTPANHAAIAKRRDELKGD
jgi:hypothetical protein